METKELKGIVRREDDDVVYLTCCDKLPELNIGDVRLLEWLGETFDLETEENGYGETLYPKSPVYRIRYTLTNADDDPSLTFEERAAEVQGAMLFAHGVQGCYSEWTCGSGGWDYLLKEGGHSIVDELANSVGKFLHLAIDIDPVEVAS